MHPDCVGRPAFVFAYALVARLQLMISTAVASTAATWPSAARKPACILPVRYTVPFREPEAVLKLMPTHSSVSRWRGVRPRRRVHLLFHGICACTLDRFLHRCCDSMYARSSASVPLRNAHHFERLADIGMYCTYLTAFSYLADAYALCESLPTRSTQSTRPLSSADPASPITDASSALSAMSFIRNLVGAVFPLFTQQMYDSLGIQGATGLVSVSLRSRPARIVTVRLAHP